MQRVWGIAEFCIFNGMSLGLLYSLTWRQLDVKKRNLDNLTWLIIANAKVPLSKSNDMQEKMNLVRYIIVFNKNIYIGGN